MNAASSELPHGTETRRGDGVLSGIRGAISQLPIEIAAPARDGVV